jgi:hypothetical protein
VPPRAVAGIDNSPAVCVIGAAARLTMGSPARYCSSSIMWAKATEMLRWVIMTPLAGPVVPPVGMIATVSSGW